MYVNEDETIRSRPLIPETAWERPVVIFTPLLLSVHRERTRPVPGISVMNSMKHFVGLAAVSSLMSKYKSCSFWCLSVMTKLQLSIPRSPIILFVCYIWTLYANPLWLIKRLLIHHHHIWCIHTVHKYSYKYVQVKSAHITNVTVHARHFLWLALQNSNIYHRNPSLHNCFSSPLSKGRTTPTPVDGKAIKWDVFYALWLLFPFRIALLQVAISGK